MIRFPSLVLAAALLLPTAHAAAPDPAEVASQRDTNERFVERMREFNADVASILSRTEEEERQKITTTYGAAMTRLEDQENTTRRVAIAKIENFLQKYPKAAPASDMKFRLADLYYEESEMDWFGRMEEYNRLEAQADIDAALKIGEPPLKDYRRSIALYQDIMSNHTDYVNLADTYYMLGWCLNAQNAQQYDEVAARDVYLALSDKWPGTAFANDANMQLGEYYFELPGTREEAAVHLRNAIDSYNRVLADGTEGRNYDKAIYKLGWAHYKLNDYQRSLAYLVQLLDYSDSQFLESGKPSNMRPEAVEYLAITYADIGDRTSRKPVDVALEHLGDVGDRKWEHDVIERLAQILLVQAKFDYAIETYRFLQTRWPLDPKNPVYQNEIARIYLTQPIPDEAASARAMADLSEKYTDGTDWYKANQTNPEAVAAARGFIEKSLAAVATEDLLRARETGNVEDYREAARKYASFLEKFPFAADYDEYQWYYALALFSSNQFKDAEREYGQILKNDRSPFREGARYQQMKSREEIVKTAYGKLEDVPKEAVVERVDTTAFGKQITRFMLSDEHKAYIAGCDDLVQREYTDPEWAPVLEKARPALAYLPAQILYNHGHYEEARTRFDRVIAQYPSTNEGAFAAGLVVAMYQAEGNLTKVRESAGRFAAMANLGGGGKTGQEQRVKLESIQEQAAFNIAYECIDKGDRACAATAFQDFIREYPSSKYVKEALYNAANNLEMIGKSDESIRLFEQYLTKYPTDEKSKFLYWRIAQNYSSILDLQKAIQYYDQLVKLFPTFEDAAAATYNAAFLRVGVGDHPGAARQFEKYATSYPGQADAEIVFWRAGEQWREVGEVESLDFYARYLKRYPTQDPNHVIESQYRIVKSYEKKGDTRRAAAMWNEIRNTFRANSGTLSSQARSMAAEGSLNDLLAQLDRFKEYKYTASEKTNVELLLKSKPAELKLLTDAAVDLIQTYIDFDTASASLYIQGVALFAYADMVYNIPPPDGLTDEEIDIYREQLDTNYRIPTEDRGKSRLQASLEKAKSEKRWGQWNSKAVEALHDRYPLEFPSERAEARGSFSAAPVTAAGPESVAPPTSGGTQ